ncbi:NAD(P)-binding protein [Rhizodiscina lignyota]|uniref:NAD(P)-binding protein n=1 Tax=Rhizodiscina lignyota TaxID=1504668 RepID=A0A9P4I6M3_9PEZI|nr:NAD(P)-binding protein [Rhizodiscina lignyota]
MASIAKTIVATGVTSGLGFEAIKQLLQQTQPYRVILGARDTKKAQADYDGLSYDSKTHSVTVLPLELADLRTVKTFARQTLDKLGSDKLDILLLNAALSKAADQPGVNGSKWCESYIVNHLSQHYLIHLLREKLVASKSRVVVVSSGGVRNVKDTSSLDEQLKAKSGVDFFETYANTKFTQLLNAHYWRRQLTGQCDVIAVSPGLIPYTGLNRYSNFQIPKDLPDAKTLPEGAKSILEALNRNDFPEDPDRIFLTSWGEWWEKDVYGLTLDKQLQDKWSPSKEQIEKEELVD